MKITFWGTRGSIPVPGPETLIYGGNTTCLELKLQSGRTVIVDAGSGIRKLGNNLTKAGLTKQIYLLLTHIHWDHILGFPFFAPIYDPSARILLDGCTTAIRGLKNIFESKSIDGIFPVKFKDLKAVIDPVDRLPSGMLEIDDVRIDAIELQHPQGGMGFRFREAGKTLIFLTDNELRVDAWPGRRPTDYINFSEGADILIHDSQYLSEEMVMRKGWGHSDCEAVVEMALKAGVKRLILFHHDPQRTDEEVEHIVLKARSLAGGDLQVDAAREETSIIL